MRESGSPVDVLLRSGARASGAMQKGLDGLVSSPNGLRALYPSTWIKLATDTLSAAINAGSPPQPLVSSVPASLSAGKAAPRPEALQALIDQDVNLHMFSVPEKKGAGFISGKTGDAIGYQINETLHRFNVIGSAPTNCAPLAARNIMGERVGACTWRWLFMPDHFVQAPGQEPPATKINPDAAQRFAMVDGLFKFGNGSDGFRGTGAGQTYPVTVRGRKQLRITAVGTLSEGFGKFRNHEDGLFIYCGLLDPASGFLGGVTLRVADRQGTLQTSNPLPPLQATPMPEQGITWLTIRAQAIPSTSVAPPAEQHGQLGMIFQQEARLVDIDFAAGGPSGLKCAAGARQPIGTVTSHVAFDPDIAAGTPNDPLPFAVWREFSFVDSLKNPIGGFTTASSDGCALVTPLSGVRGIRFAGTGRILKGTGRFDGISGVITENTLAVLDPYAGSSVYTLRVEDPMGYFFSRDGVWRDIPVSEVTPHTDHS